MFKLCLKCVAAIFEFEKCVTNTKSLERPGIKNWAAIAGGENGESRNEFLGESDSDDEYVYCESNYNNSQSEENIQITEKKEPDTNCLGTQAKPTFFA